MQCCPSGSASCCASCCPSCAAACNCCQCFAVCKGTGLNHESACPCRYSADDLSRKAICKRALQREMLLPFEPDIPLIGFIGRLDYQKGPDLVLDALPVLGNLDCQVCQLALVTGCCIAMHQFVEASTPLQVRNTTQSWCKQRLLPTCHPLYVTARFTAYPSDMYLCLCVCRL